MKKLAIPQSMLLTPIHLATRAKIRIGVYASTPKAEYMTMRILQSMQRQL